jgi:hypothetical protein
LPGKHYFASEVNIRYKGIGGKSHPKREPVNRDETERFVRYLGEPLHSNVI